MTEGAHGPLSARQLSAMLGLATASLGCPAPETSEPIGPWTSHSRTVVAHSPLSAPDASAWRAHLEQWRGSRLNATFAANGATPTPIEAACPQGKATVIAFWATYCPPCIAEMPMFDRLYGEGYAIVGVSLDAGNEADLKRVLDRWQPRYPQPVLDEPSMKAAGKALATGLPFTVVVDPKHQPRYAFAGQAEEHAVLSALRSAAAP